MNLLQNLGNLQIGKPAPTVGQVKEWTLVDDFRYELPCLYDPIAPEMITPPWNGTSDDMSQIHPAARKFYVTSENRQAFSKAHPGAGLAPNAIVEEVANAVETDAESMELRVVTKKENEQETSSEKAASTSSRQSGPTPRDKKSASDKYASGPQSRQHETARLQLFTWLHERNMYHCAVSHTSYPVQASHSVQDATPDWMRVAQYKAIGGWFCAVSRLIYVPRMWLNFQSSRTQD